MDNNKKEKTKMSLEEAKKTKGKTNFGKLLSEQNKEKSKKWAGEFGVRAVNK